MASIPVSHVDIYNPMLDRHLEDIQAFAAYQAMNRSELFAFGADLRS